MSRKISIDVHPYGKVEIEVYAALINDELKVCTVIADYIFLPIVSASVSDARNFAKALLESADAAERAEAGFFRPPGPTKRS